MSCYAFDEKDKDTNQLTWKKKYCIKWNQMYSDWKLSRYQWSFYLDEDDFVEKFSNDIDVNAFNLGLWNKILEVQLVWSPKAIVEKIPEKKSENVGL